MAATGHKSLATFQKYLSKRKLAEIAMIKWEGNQVTVETAVETSAKEGTMNDA